MRTNHYREWRGRGHYHRVTDLDFILFYSLMLVSGRGGGGGRGGGDSVRALSKYLGRDTTYTMIMWAGLVRYLRGGAASGLAELESRLDRSGV